VVNAGGKFRAISENPSSCRYVYIQVEQHCALGARGCGGTKRGAIRRARRRIREKAARESNDSASVTYLQRAGGTRAFTRVNRLVYLFLGRASSSSSLRLVPSGKGTLKQRDMSPACTKLRQTEKDNHFSCLFYNWINYFAEGTSLRDSCVS